MTGCYDPPPSPSLKKANQRKIIETTRPLDLIAKETPIKPELSVGQSIMFGLNVQNFWDQYRKEDKKGKFCRDIFYS